MGSNPAKVDGFLKGDKNQWRSFLQKGSNAGEGHM
jgi:hypothetical protein